MADQYVWSSVYIDALIERDTPTQRMYVQQDMDFNVTALVDTTGTVQERYIYDPYGSVTILAANWTTRGSSNYGWVYFHQGGRYDFATGLYSFRNRDYSPTLGRWIENDPLGFGGGDTNLYGSLANNPTSNLDPLGLETLQEYLRKRYPDISDITVPGPINEAEAQAPSTPLRPSFNFPQYTVGPLTPEHIEAWKKKAQEKFWNDWNLNMLGPGGWWWEMWMAGGMLAGGGGFKPFERPPEVLPAEPTRPVPELVLPKPPAPSGGGLLKALPPGRSPGVITVPSPSQLNNLFDNLTRGGTKLHPGTYPGDVVLTPDGSIVRRRRSQDFGPTLDITCPDGSRIKVHVKDK